MNPQPKITPWRSKEYRTWIGKSHTCCTCSAGDIVYAHHEQEEHQGGMGTKPGDDRCLPLCWRCHAERHRTNREFWAKYRKDPEALIRLFHARWVALGNRVGEI